MLHFADYQSKLNKSNKKDHLIIIHRESEQEELNKLINVKLTKEYGRSKIIFGTLS